MQDTTAAAVASLSAEERSSIRAHALTARGNLSAARLAALRHRVESAQSEKKAAAASATSQRCADEHNSELLTYSVALTRVVAQQRILTALQRNPQAAAGDIQAAEQELATLQAIANRILEVRKKPMGAVGRQSEWPLIGEATVECAGCGIVSIVGLRGPVTRAAVWEFLANRAPKDFEQQQMTDVAKKAVAAIAAGQDAPPFPPVGRTVFRVPSVHGGWNAGGHLH